MLYTIAIRSKQIMCEKVVRAVVELQQDNKIRVPLNRVGVSFIKHVRNLNTHVCWQECSKQMNSQGKIPKKGRQQREEETLIITGKKNLNQLEKKRGWVPMHCHTVD